VPSEFNQEAFLSELAYRRAQIDAERHLTSAALESTKIFYFEFDAETGAFRFANQLWMSKSGWMWSEIVGKPFFDFVHPDDYERTLEAFKENTDKARAVTRQFKNRYRKKNGEYISLRWLEGIWVEDKYITAWAEEDS
jgi:PAS domain S-box-containing protein